MAIDFPTAFAALTEHPPFPWQEALYKRFADGDIPDSCNLPTGLGKTSVIAVWLIAFANFPDKMPRRLVYVVNRRTVVDQTTDEVEKYRKNLSKVPEIEEALWSLCSTKPKDPKSEKDFPLAISTLRGQFADNREWSADPSRPAIICGTVDMIGSRLLFSGYGVGFKAKPLHAGFLGQDALLVHDEAHLEPAFQKLIESIRDEQNRCKEFAKFRVMELTATSRGAGQPFGLSDADRAVEEVDRRINAKKAIVLHENKDEKKLAEEIAALASVHKDSGLAILVFVRRVDDVDKVIKALPRGSKAEQLTGTLRGKERDELVKKPTFQRFLHESNRNPSITPEPGTVYLVCTSAGEVGVNISADHLVSDLTTFESMAQRLGRVNRFGICIDTRVDIVYPKEFAKGDKLDDIDRRRMRTLDLLKKLDGDGCPRALGEAHRKALQEGSGTTPMSTDQTQALRDYILSTYAPQPTILPVTDILFDSWRSPRFAASFPAVPTLNRTCMASADGNRPRRTSPGARKSAGSLATCCESTNQLTCSTITRSKRTNCFATTPSAYSIASAS